MAKNSLAKILSLKPWSALSLGGICLMLGLTVVPGAGAVTPSPKVSSSPSVSAPAVSSKASPSTSATAPSGDSIRTREYWLTQYGFTNLWKETTGKGVTIAVIDTGVDGTHQDLTGNVLKGYDVSGKGDSSGWKGLGLEPEHGTLVASVIAGHGHALAGLATNPGEPGYPAGVIGIAPEAKILPISLELGSSSAKTKSADEQIPAAVRKAVDAGAQIINLSVGSSSTTWPQSWDSAFEYAEEKGVLIVASAGNRGAGITQVGAPATMPGVLTVGGIDKNGKASTESSTDGISIAVVAPSENLVGAYPSNKYAVWDGTSASAPIVSGLAALIKEKYPNLTSNQIIERIIGSATDAGASGRDPQYGFGIINPQKALATDTPDETTSNPLGSISAWVAVQRKQSAQSSSSASASASVAPIHQLGEKIAEPQVPVASRPTEDSGILPFVVLGGFAAWVFIITLGSIRRLRRLFNSYSNR